MTQTRRRSNQKPDGYRRMRRGPPSSHCASAGRRRLARSGRASSRGEGRDRGARRAPPTLPESRRLHQARLNGHPWVLIGCFSTPRRGGGGGSPMAFRKEPPGGGRSCSWRPQSAKGSRAFTPDSRVEWLPQGPQYPGPLPQPPQRREVSQGRVRQSEPLVLRPLPFHPALHRSPAALTEAGK